jgi:hypothetical protein
LVAFAACSGGLPSLLAREEPNPPSAAMAAATMNNEQMRRRKRGHVNTRFNVRELFFLSALQNGVRHLPDAALIEDLVCFPIPGT